jgi:lysophospholipase L1-like esterase
MAQNPTDAQLGVNISTDGFPPPAIIQWRKDGQSIPGASSGDFSFNPEEDAGGYSVTATFPNVIPTADNTWDPSPMAIVIIGDSTSGDQGFGDPTAGMPSEMLAFSGRKLTIVANCYANGTTTRDWADTSDGSLLSKALAKAKAGNATHVTICLGPNDCSVNHQIPPSEFKGNLMIICQAINANGQKAIIHYGLLPLVGAGENSWTKASIDLGLSYRPQIDSLIDRKNILLGDTQLADYLHDNPATYIGGTLQETPLVGGYHQWITGVQHTSRMQAEGCEFAITPSARSLRSTWNLPPLVNPDKSINWANRALRFTLWDRDSISKRLGGHFKSFHPGSPPDTREVYYHYPDKLEPFVRDHFGTGNTVTTDSDLGHPGQTFETWPTAQEVKPYNLGGPPGIDPGIGNLGPLPQNAVDILHPDNNPGGYNTTQGVVARDVYLQDPSKYTVLSGRGDGFTPASIFLQQHRQDYIEQKPGLYSYRWGGNYWSVRGQALCVPKDRTTPAGPIQKIQFGAYYDLCIRTSPKAGDAFWGPSVPNCSCIYVSDKIVCGEALAVDPVKRILTVLTSPTSRDGDAPPPPVYQFPEGEMPMWVSSSDMNELAAVVVWTSTGSKVVIFALQGYALKNHSQPWYAFSNLGSFSGFRRICERQLKAVCADRVKIGTDAALAPQPDPGSINLADPNQRAGYSNFDDHQRYMCFPKKCWFAATSREEGTYEMFDFTLWMKFVWDQYMEPDQTKWEATRAAHDDGAFPPTIDARPDLAPTPILSFPIERPTCMLASGYGGPEIGWDYSDIQKLAIGCEDGTVKFVNISSYADPYNWTGYNPTPTPDWAKPSLWGSIWVGRGLIHMAWARFTIPNSEIHYLNVMNKVTARGDDQDAQGFANAFYCVCRGDNQTKLVINHWDEGNHRQVSATHLIIQGSEVKDHTSVSVQDRFNIVNITDGDGEALHSFQKGTLGRSPEPDSAGNQNAYPGFSAPPNPDDPTKLIGWCGKYSLDGFCEHAVGNNGN